MTPADLERAFSLPRFKRYVDAAEGDYIRGHTWYKGNLRLSAKLFTVISVFEVIFRNAIDRHYATRYGAEWLLSESGDNGFLSKRGCEKTRSSVKNAIGWRDAYVHDRVVATLGLPFWRSLFNSKEFSAGGDSLLKIFPNRPKGKALNHTYVYNKLHPVAKIRNRIAHHDPICFAPKSSEISTEWPLKAYDSMTELMGWLGFEPEKLLDGIDFVKEEITLSFLPNASSKHVEKNH
jgi:hypothetical protein